jgi:uncharacterized protein (TIGR00730 family)
MPLRRVAVFCGSSTGRRDAYRAAAQDTGQAIAARGLELVYGGAGRGLMGIMADAVLEGGGRVTGVIPRSMVQREVAHTGLTELRIVETMHQRKAEMASLADGFLALPGGLGTLEELFETWTWAQLGMHDKPFGVLNVAGYFDPLLGMVERMVGEGFIPADQVARLRSDSDPGLVLDWLNGAGA